jgi:hypothetical protein
MPDTADTCLVTVKEDLLIGSVQALKEQHTLLKAAMPLQAALKCSKLLFQKSQKSLWPITIPATHKMFGILRIWSHANIGNTVSQEHVGAQRRAKTLCAITILASRIITQYLNAASCKGGWLGTHLLV